MKRIKTSTHWLVLIICIIISFSIFIFTFKYSTALIKDSNRDKIQTEYKYLVNHIRLFQNDRKAYLSILANHIMVVEYLKELNTNSEKKVIKLFEDQMKKIPLIMQIRVLSLDGNELIKLDNRDDNIEVVSKDKLQNKSYREYFKHFIKLEKNEMGISPLDLNIENGKIDIPFRATLRIAMPVFNAQKKEAIVIINYEMNDWLKENIISTFLNVDLVDKDGYFIISSDNKNNWSKYQSNKLTIKDKFNVNISELDSSIYTNTYKDDFIVKSLRLWNNELFYIVYSFKDSKDTNLFINQSKIIAISIIFAILILILPFFKILYEYLNILKKSEFKIKKILDNSLDSIIMINEKGKIQTVNKTTLVTFGYTENELVGKNVNILIPEPHHSRHDEYLASHDRTMMTKVLTTQRELFGISKNKRLIPISLSITKINIDAETFFIGSIRDIEKERESKKLFENVFNESPLGIALVLPDGTFWRLNSKFASIIGYTNKEAVKLTFKDITHKDDIEKDISHVKQLLRKEIDKYSMEKRYIHKNGTVVWVNLSVTPVFLDDKKEKIEYFIAVIEDITEKKAVNEKLLEAEKISLLGHWDWNIKDNSFSWSDMILNIFEIKDSNFIPSYENFINVIHPEDKQSVEKGIQYAIDNKQPLDMEYKVIVENKTKTIHLKGTTTYLNDDAINIFGTCQDITIIKELQEKEKNQEHLLMQQSKLVSMGEMVAAIAHQWRQPLNSIGLAVQDLVSAYKHNEIDEEYLIESRDEIMEQLNYMSITIDEFRNFFTKSNKIVEFNIIGSLKEIISFSWAQLKENAIYVDIYIYKDNKKVNINELIDSDFNEYKLNSRISELKQLVINCLSNAKDAIVKLEDSNQINHKIDILVVKKDNNTFDIIITDYAGGIDSQTKDRIFEPYFTTKEMGTGLGLYISKMVMEKSLKGTISYADSELNHEGKKYKGSSFIINLSSIS
ncbi:MAG: PAS domain S-box protein [Arcobacter sp.]|uniref:PAS domain S-box protein n=1 Tax=Arcobacter sp. TaxID=1872629 RepID=UPI003AFFD575